MQLVKRKFVRKKLIGGVGALVMAFAAAGAQATTLSFLIDRDMFDVSSVCTLAGASTHCIMVDDKLFDDFQVFNNNLFGATPEIRAAHLNNIAVTPDDTDPDPSNPGLVFTASNFALTAFDDAASLDFGFRVSVLPGANMAIKDNTLSLTGFSVGSGNDKASITEFVCNTVGLCSSTSSNLLAQKNVTAYGTGNNVLEDIQNFAQQDEIWVRKLIELDAGPGTGFGGEAAITSFEQHFSQVPEPGAFALFALGLIGVGFGRRRQHPVAPRY